MLCGQSTLQFRVEPGSCNGFARTHMLHSSQAPNACVSHVYLAQAIKQLRRDKPCVFATSVDLA
eukprot:5771706-Alexandrium_andersonii.AAC.1